MSVIRRQFSPEFKQELCEKIVLGQVSKASACREHSLSPSLLDRWVERYRKVGAEAFAAPVELSNEKRIR